MRSNPASAGFRCFWWQASCLHYRCRLAPKTRSNKPPTVRIARLSTSITDTTTTPTIPSGANNNPTIMRKTIGHMVLALASLLFLGCDTSMVSRAEYDALAAYADSLEADNDLLHFELQDLMLYNDHLASRLDSCELANTSPKE